MPQIIIFIQQKIIFLILKLFNYNRNINIYNTNNNIFNINTFNYSNNKKTIFMAYELPALTLGQTKVPCVAGAGSLCLRASQARALTC